LLELDGQRSVPQHEGQVFGFPLREVAGDLAATVEGLGVDRGADLTTASSSMATRFW